MAKTFTKLVSVPRPEHMNGGLTYPSVDFIVKLLGKPRQVMTDDCRDVSNAVLRQKMVYGLNVGGFNVSGLKMAAESLRRIFAKVKKNNPELYSAVGTAGMLCCRNIRGTSGFNPSNHSWGAAIDLTISGRLDNRGDGKCFEGLLLLYPYFHNEGWYWGAEYSGKWEDAMHFEVARETLQRWYRK